MQGGFPPAEHHPVEQPAPWLQKAQCILIAELAFAGDNIRIITVQAFHITACKPKYAGCLIRVVQKGKWSDAVYR